MCDRPGELTVGEWIGHCLSERAAHLLTPEDVRLLDEHLVPSSLYTGQPVFQRGCSTRGAWFLRSGRVELTEGTGARRRVLALVRPGEVFGDIPLMLAIPAPYRARAATPVSLWMLPERILLWLLAERTSLARLWLSSLAERVLHVHGHLTDLRTGTLRQRVARLLLRESHGDVVGVSQATLASLGGCPRSSMNRVLRSLAAEAVISLGYRRITLLDPARLAAIAERGTPEDSTR